MVNQNTLRTQKPSLPQIVGAQGWIPDGGQSKHPAPTKTILAARRRGAGLISVQPYLTQTLRPYSFHPVNYWNTAGALTDWRAVTFRTLPNLLK